MNGTITKTANAFFVNANYDLGVIDLMGPLARIIDLKGSIKQSLDNYIKNHDGLWIGGTITLTAELLEFDANAVNRQFHGQSSRRIALADILHVEYTPQWVSSIVDAVLTDGSFFRFRCWGAKDIYDILSNFVAKNRP